ncbi:MAG: GDP-L-fucose synthase [Candidatus Scalindua sp. AMX11]|nr:MAG: GDP-L-fucose synthase [Candidatus Scalindua sp.]NOG82914.1 GDP-L-fucose synthase [Planctomycetota bacterium]RZV86253.1 MAG: GDP-L-fucose synthase [Candidatus Scalindua sp. SCAELEC01]TDE65876.1 MAG: GDP-L-fucose synthase [Candidatus Scalindua sp. AMX11]GJQ60284.1 MAG: GDP-L-fucose synthase [Candidatus Scalindua sp.]
MNKSSKIYVAGHKGLVGSAIMRKLQLEGYTNLIIRSKNDLDLTRQSDVEGFFAKERPEYVFLAAAKVGGIVANNTYPAEFIYSNLIIQTNIIHASYKYNIKKLLFLGSSCIYPKFAPQPMKEEYLLTGALEATNEPYAVAKIAGLKMCQSYNRQYGSNFISVMPTNLYGPNDNFDLNNSHVLPALIRKFYEAKLETQQSVTLWGTGSPCREFLFADDLANACLFLMLSYDENEIVNIGTGKDITIEEVAGIIKDVIGYKGEVLWDDTKPDGTPRKLLDVTKINELGWQARTSLEEGIKKTYTWYAETY